MSSTPKRIFPKHRNLGKIVNKDIKNKWRPNNIFSLFVQNMAKFTIILVILVDFTNLPYERFSCLFAYIISFIQIYMQSQELAHYQKWYILI